MRCTPAVLAGTVLTFVASAINSSDVFAATRYVGRNGACANHSTIGTAFVSCADSRTAGCTAAKPCCTFQDGSNAAKADGDVIEVHDGTYTDATGYTDSTGSYAFLNAKASVRLNTAGVTLKRAAGDTPTLDLGTTNDLGVLAVADRITVDGLRFIGGLGGTDNTRSGHVYAAQTSDVKIRNNVFEVGTTNHVESVSGSMCVMLKNSINFLIEDNTCSGGWDFSFWVYSTSRGGGGVVRRNAQIGNGRGGVGPQRGMMFELLGSRGDNGVLLIYGNTLEQAPSSETTWGFYLREIHWKVYLFNNIIRGVNGTGVYFQDDLCSGSPEHYHSEQWNIFNNTFIAKSSGADTGIRWPGCVEGKVTNNIFSGFNSGTEMKGGCPVQICDTRDDALRSTVNASFTYNLCHLHSSCA